LVDEWIVLGLRDAVVCPGSRSTPLALALGGCSEICLHVRLDERSAAFYALGVALASSRPVLVLVTSGTAAAEVHAAVCEADLSAVPLIVVSADRPPELHGVGAPQTIDQSGLYGPVVRDFAEPGVARLEAGPSWRPLARRLWRRARGEGSLAGPVHLNAAFVEPLVASPGNLPARGASEVVVSEPGVVRLSLAGRRVLVVAGARCDRVSLERLAGASCVIVGDVTLHEGLAHADVVVRDDEISRELRPDLVIRLGGLPSSKVLGQRLREWAAPSVAVSWAEDPADPDGLVATFVRGRVELTDHDHADETYATRWRELSSAVARGLGELELWSEPTVGAEVTREALESSRSLVVGSSMPVRDVEWWAPTRRGPVYANRGANGIDGVVSTLCGVASVTPAIGLVGDLTMLHDVSALVEGAPDSRATLVVLDNRGGGIFSFLSQRTQLEEDRFELLFGTPRLHDLVAVARSFSHHAERVRTLETLREALKTSRSREGLSVIVAELPSRDENVATHAWLVDRAKEWMRA
jgi:2-succinyl-5-enolpyruvyl-6-hydroxy-3-cyclohexene-1-carboxylate synthase